MSRSQRETTVLTGKKKKKKRHVCVFQLCSFGSLEFPLALTPAQSHQLKLTLSGCKPAWAVSLLQCYLWAFRLRGLSPNSILQHVPMSDGFSQCLCSAQSWIISASAIAIQRSSSATSLSHGLMKWQEQTLGCHPEKWAWPLWTSLGTIWCFSTFPIKCMPWSRGRHSLPPAAGLWVQAGLCHPDSVLKIKIHFPSF